MGDLAESIDDLICTFENVTNTTMDTLAMIIFCWLLIALFLLWLCKFIYHKYVLKEQSPATITSEKLTKTDVVKSETIASGGDTPSSSLSSTPDKLIKLPATKKGGSGYVPPTPPVRKRLSRRSPGPDLLKKSHPIKPAPKCTGPDNVSVQWVNNVFQWLYNDFVVVNELLHEWILSLNEFTKKSVAEHGVGVEFMRILPETGAPTLTNVFCECDSKEDVTITCDCDATAALQLKCFRQKGEKVEISHYRVNINRFRARLNIVSISEKLLATLKLDGWPEIKINLAPVGTIKNNLDESQLQDVITEIVVTAIRNTELHMNLSQYQSCPRLIRHPVAPAQVYPVHYDGMTLNRPTLDNQYQEQNMMTSNMPGDKRLLVKVIRAGQLKASDDGIPLEPYCVVEMDEPFQKNQTSVKKCTDSPVWDEHFLFDLSTNTAELLFEIYDRANKSNRFLGLGIVGVEELLINPSQRQIISLQNRPYETDNVTGTLTVEFLFIEGADIPMSGNKPYKLKETLRTVSPTGQLITTTKTTFEGMTNGTTDLTDSALKELERNKQGNNANKSTLIIHSVQRQPFERQTVKVVPQRDGSFQEADDDEEIKCSDQEKPGELQTTGNDQMSDLPMASDHETASQQETRGRSRKKRDFFGTIRRRFGRSQTRSKSAGRQDTSGDSDDAILNRSISADRTRNSNMDDGGGGGYRISVPPGLNKSFESNSRRSSLSEASGVSGASTRTYLNEASTLVLETLENGIKKHYLVPLSLAQKSRWRKKGTKLHIFNDHTFVAKHLNGGTVCQVCSKSIARRIGKQGYECRDCLIKCHKQCHVKAIDNCPQSTIHNMELSLLPVLSE